MPRPRISEGCLVDNCHRPHKGRGYCGHHLYRVRKYGTPELPAKVFIACLVEGCEKRATSLQYCPSHYQKFKLTSPDRQRCTLDDCDRPQYAKGYCELHWKRDFKHGDPHYQRIGKGAAFILDIATKCTSNECLPYPYGTTSFGYGQLSFEGKRRVAHSLVCELVHGPKPSPRHEAAHRCGNPICCNPVHLRWALPKENTADKKIHGTQTRGETHGTAKLTTEQVILIRSTPDVPSSEMAQQLGVCAATIRDIRRRKRWAWLK